MLGMLEIYQTGGVDYAPHLGVSPHLFGTLLQPWNLVCLVFKKWAGFMQLRLLFVFESGLNFLYKKIVSNWP